MDRAERERHAYDEGALWERSHRAHMRFPHVFESPNTRRGDRLYERLLRDAVPGKRVLELGCAEGSQSRAVLAFGAAYVLGTDVSERFLAEARGHTVPGRLEFANLDAAGPPGGRFDVIFGSAILHHLDFRGVVERLYQETLTPGGTMIFREPLGANLMIRAWWWLGTSAHSPDERPLYPDDLRWLRARFQNLRLHGVNYLSLPAGILSSLICSSADNALLRGCDHVDHWLARRCTWLVPRFRQTVMVIQKPGALRIAPARRAEGGTDRGQT
jgi:2-polyprenyl-3-methyl-5-hydroxy-6-metoxy-1,4-benzoquinol methylase